MISANKFLSIGLGILSAFMLGGCFGEDESKQGMVRITTDPGDAQLFINGERKGSSPAEVGQSFAIKLKEGTYTISALKPDGEEYEYVGKKEGVFVAPETMQSVVLKLERKQTPEGVRLEDERAYSKATQSNTSSAYKRYISDYPKGKFVSEAKKLAEIRATEEAEREAKRKAEEERIAKEKEAKRKADIAKEIFTDDSTKLMWQDSIITKTTKRNWSSAISYCKNLNHAGYSDWRLPNKDELLKLYPQKSHLKNVASNYYWSSSTYVGGTSAAWFVFFYSGDTSAYNKSGEYYVRCVRGRQ